MRLIRRGTYGDDVRDVQSRLVALGYRLEPEEMGTFGASTERAVCEFQQRRDLLVDGLVGEDTWQELVEASHTLGDRTLYLRYPLVRGDDVRALQARLNLLGFDPGREDGIFGESTDRALRDFQSNVGLPADGILGAATLDALKRLRPVARSPGRAEVREGEALLHLDVGIDGAPIAVDAGHGGRDSGAVGSSGLTEAAVAYQLAQAFAEALSARGASPVLLRDAHTDPPTSERAKAANEAGARALVAIHLNSHTDPTAEGSSAYYYGREGWSSQAGHRLAELLQEELTSGLGLKDGRTHPKSLPLLRETRMPAVHVEPCFITNPREEALLRQESFLRNVAAALASGVERFFAVSRAISPD